MGNLENGECGEMRHDEKRIKGKKMSWTGTCVGRRSL